MKQTPDLILLSMPYACISRREMLSPSLPLGTLKALLETNGYHVKAIHAHLDFLYTMMEYPDWSFVIEHFRIPVVHAYGLDMLFMSMAEGKTDTDPAMRKLLHFIYESSPGRKLLPFSVFEKKALRLRKQLSDFIDTVIAQLQLDSCSFFGMSCVHGQMFASVELARRIHEKNLEAKIIFGGIDCQAETARLLLHRYPYITCVAIDEGEVPLLKFLASGGSPEGIPGLAYKDKNGAIVVHPPEEPFPMEELPLPDFSEFFARVKASDLPEVTLPVFASRGCPWKRCTFCNIPGDRSFGYRHKSAEKFADEIINYTKQYPFSLEFTLVDNDIAVSEQFYAVLAEKVTGMDLLFAGHGHATRLTQPMLHAMKAAGFYGIEVGIEALSESLLNKIDKGSQVVDNLKALKLLRENGIESWSNIIPNYPTETKEEVTETLAVIHKAKHLLYGSHLTLSTFMLYPRCGIWRNAEQWGLKDIRLEASEYLTGYDVSDGSWFTLHHFTREHSGTEPIWVEIEQSLAHYESVLYPCFYKQTSAGVVVYDFRHAGELRATYLQGMAADIFLACAHQPVPKAQLAALAKRPDSVEEALGQLVQKNLIFESSGRFLALPTKIYPVIEKFISARIEIDAGLISDPFTAVGVAQTAPTKPRRALLVIDVQNAFMNEFTEHLPAKIRAYIEHNEKDYAGVFFTFFKNQADTLFYTWHQSDGCMTPPDTALPEVLQELSNDENTFSKHGFSAFCGSPLSKVLKKLYVQDIDIAGLDTDACVLATAMQAFEMGFKPHILTSLCASSSGPDACQQGLEILARHVDIDLVLE